MTLAKDIGIEVREIAIPREMLYLADELFFTGTATEVAADPLRGRHPDRQRQARSRSPHKLQAAYFGLVQGKTQDKLGLARLRRHECAEGRQSRVEHPMTMPKTMFEKVWDDHVVVPETADTPAVLFIDLHLTHEVTTPQAYTELRDARPQAAPPGSHARHHGSLHAHAHRAGVRRRADRGRLGGEAGAAARDQRAASSASSCSTCRTAAAASCTSSGPSSGITQPGKTIVCGDSHTSTHGAFGALAFGIGTTEVGHVLATQCLLQRRPKTFAINVVERAAAGRHRQGPDPRHHRQDRRLGRHRATCSSFAAPAIEALSMDERMTICNMSIEAGARAGMIAPDATTFEYLAEHAARAQGRGLGCGRRALEQTTHAMPARSFDRTVDIDAGALVPMVTYGTHPGMVAPITGTVPAQGDAVFEKALKYMGLKAGEPISQRAGEQCVRRQLHQRPPLGSAQCRARAARPQARRRA